MAEVGWSRGSGEGDAALPGNYKVGGWIHTADFGGHGENFGLYVAAEQMVWTESPETREQGLGVFARVGGGPEGRSPLPWVIDAGLHYTGLIPGRDGDLTAVGFVHADINDGRRGHDAFRNYEQVLELTYEVVIRSWWSIQPDVQWILRPGGESGPGHAFLIGLRSTVTF